LDITLSTSSRFQVYLDKPEELNFYLIKVKGLVALLIAIETNWMSEIFWCWDVCYSEAQSALLFSKL